jgi:hypothetical protein
MPTFLEFFTSLLDRFAKAAAYPFVDFTAGAVLAGIALNAPPNPIAPFAALSAEVSNLTFTPIASFIPVMNDLLSAVILA